MIKTMMMMMIEKLNLFGNSAFPYNQSIKSSGRGIVKQSGEMGKIEFIKRED